MIQFRFSDLYYYLLYFLSDSRKSSQHSEIIHRPPPPTSTDLRHRSPPTCATDFHQPPPLNSIDAHRPPPPTSTNLRHQPPTPTSTDLRHQPPPTSATDLHQSIPLSLQRCNWTTLKKAGFGEGAFWTHRGNSKFANSVLWSCYAPIARCLCLSDYSAKQQNACDYRMLVSSCSDILQSISHHTQTHSLQNFILNFILIQCSVCHIYLVCK